TKKLTTCVIVGIQLQYCLNCVAASLNYLAVNRQVSHLVRDQGVGGSNPLSPTKSKQATYAGFLQGRDSSPGGQSAQGLSGFGSGLLRSEAGALRFRPAHSEVDVQLATQYSSQAEDARTEQHDAAGLRSRRAVAFQGERFRRNRAQGVLIGRRRSAVLIPADRVGGAAGRGAGIAQGYKSHPSIGSLNRQTYVVLFHAITILASAQEGVGTAGQRPGENIVAKRC